MRLPFVPSQSVDLPASHHSIQHDGEACLPVTYAGCSRPTGTTHVQRYIYTVRMFLAVIPDSGTCLLKGSGYDFSQLYKITEIHPLTAARGRKDDPGGKQFRMKTRTCLHIAINTLAVTTDPFELPSRR